MTIPDHQQLMLPLLLEIADGKEHYAKDLVRKLSDRFKLSQEARESLLPSGQQTIIGNRVAWSKTYLKKAGLIVQPSRGIVQLSKIGAEVLSKKPTKIDNEFLKQFSEFNEFLGSENLTDNNAEAAPFDSGDQIPEETIDFAYKKIRSALADELIERIKNCSPQFFERLVVDLLLAMGYGGTIDDAGKAIGGTGDGGIDGIIKQDKLGLDIVCIQAKRWKESVGRPHINAFVGSMEGFRARKGVFITTSTFTKEAKDYVKMTERKIVLIDGKMLAELMIDHGVGVNAIKTYVLHRADLDYFVEADE